MQLVSDEEIISLFFARSQKAVQALDDKYGALCRQVSDHIVSDSRDAEECVNDAYLCVWNTVPPEKPLYLRAFLCKIVRNLSLKRWEHQRAAKRGICAALPLEELDDCFSTPGRVEDRLEADELARALGAFLDTLSPDNRVIFLRRYWFSEPYSEIAKQVGLSEKNVSVRLSRIRKQLKGYLIERGPIIKFV